MKLEKDISLPSIVDVIMKVKNMEELTPEEELIYLMHIEEVPEEEARMIVGSKNYGDTKKGNI